MKTSARPATVAPEAAVGRQARAQPDQRPAAVAQRQLLTDIAASPRQVTQRQAQPNRTGLPDQLKAGIENLSGHALDDVRVHRNSARPAHLQAHAYAQGTDIHLAPGQEKHLPHEAWHVVQQKQGRVKPTMQLKGVHVNDSDKLEKEADQMGARAAGPAAPAGRLTETARPAVPTVQRAGGSDSDSDSGEMEEDEEEKEKAAKKQKRNESQEPKEQEEEEQEEEEFKRPVQGLSRGRQLHLGARTDKAKGKGQLTVLENHDRSYGEKIAAKYDSGGKGFKDAYREPQIQHKPNLGGAGLDERVSTATTEKIHKATKKEGLSKKERQQAIGTLSENRTPVTELLWQTGDSAQPLAGHPGALSKAPKDMRRGITKGHGSADRTRAKWVSNEYDTKKKKGAKLKERLGPTALMGNVMTTSLMSQPLAQTSNIDVSKANPSAYHAKHGKIYEKEGKKTVPTANYHRAIGEAHNARERQKWQNSEDLVRQGYSNVADPTMQEYILKHGSADAALSAFTHTNGTSATDTGASSSLAYVPGKKDKPVDLQTWDQEAKKNRRKRGVSPPRKLVGGQQRPSQDPPPKAQRQLTLTESMDRGRKRKRDDRK